MRAYWFEEYSKCGCVSDAVTRKGDLSGYCPKHGNDRSNVFKGVGGYAAPIAEMRQIADEDAHQRGKDETR